MPAMVRRGERITGMGSYDLFVEFVVLPFVAAVLFS